MKVATVTMDGEEFYFASLDGELYLGITRPATPEDEDHVRALIEGKQGFKPMLIHERALNYNSEQMVITGS